jgi:thiopurine S-methyltransferase
MGFEENSEEDDLIIEQTFFWALDPGLRQNYVDQVFKLLKPEGKLVGVLFDADFNDGPPFGGNKVLYTDLFQDLFKIHLMERCYNSIKPRMDRELFINIEKRSFD